MGIMVYSLLIRLYSTLWYIVRYIPYYAIYSLLWGTAGFYIIIQPCPQAELLELVLQHLAGGPGFRA